MRRLYMMYLNFKYRELPDDVCCCGDDMDRHYETNHSAKSMRTWMIQCHIANRVKYIKRSMDKFRLKGAK